MYGALRWLVHPDKHIGVSHGKLIFATSVPINSCQLFTHDITELCKHTQSTTYTRVIRLQKVTKLASYTECTCKHIYGVLSLVAGVLIEQWECLALRPALLAQEIQSPPQDGEMGPQSW